MSGRVRRTGSEGQHLSGLSLRLHAVARSLDAQLQELARSYGVEQVELRRSDRRRRSVSAFRENGTLVFSAPSRISATELLELASDLLRRVLAKERAHSTDDELQRRAAALASTYLPSHLPAPASVRWTNARATWGSCVSADRTISISRALMGMPDWVLDYVLVHELAHLLEANHGRRFYELVSRYPRWEQARAFLDGVSWQARSAGAVPSSEDADLAVDGNPPSTSPVEPLSGNLGGSTATPPASSDSGLKHSPGMGVQQVPQPGDLFDFTAD